MHPDRPTHFIATAAEFSALLERLRGERALALDTEGNSFHAYRDRVCLIQLSTRDEDWAVDPLALDLAPLGPLLADPAVEVVVHAADYDIRGLKRDFGFCFGRLFDTMLAARLLGRRELGLAALVRQAFGVELAKQQQCSNWGRRPLSAAQVAYAYLDTRYLLPLRDLLHEELERAGKLEQARQIFARQSRCQPRARRFDAAEVRHLRGYAELERAARRVARVLFELREALARSCDRPPFKIFGNEVIVALARNPPRSADELKRVKGLGGWVVERHGEELWRALRSAEGAERDAG
jgi:ribonuclease D